MKARAALRISPPERLLLLALLAFAGRLPAQGRPVAGPDSTWVVEDRVSLLAGAPAGCIALEAVGGKAAIILPLQEVVDLAARANDARDTLRAVSVERPPTKVVPEPRGARALLKLVQPKIDGRGCRVLSTDRLSMSLAAFVGGLIEVGHAAVFTHHSNLAEPALIVRRVTSEVFAYDEFVLLDGTSVWHCPLWMR